jgi:hypothetical protein
MSRRLYRSPRGSMDLLLDTMCNAFGSIILIALLIVIISSEVPTVQPVQSSVPDKDHVERQIARAQETLSRLAADLEALPPNPLADEARDLQARIEAAKRRLEEAREDESSMNDQRYVDVSGTVSELRQEERRIRERLTALQNEKKTLEEREKLLREQIAKIEQEIQKMVDDRTEVVRLPKERSTSLGPSPVIFLYNEIFWMHPNDSRNTTALEWTDKGDSVLVSPRRGRGLQIPQNTSDLARFLDHQKRSHFLACYVFPDSVEVFRKFRKLAVSRGAEVAWSLEIDPDTLIFSSTGSSPKPQ